MVCGIRAVLETPASLARRVCGRWAATEPSPDQLLFAEESECMVTAGLGVPGNLSDHWVEMHSRPFWPFQALGA